MKILPYPPLTEKDFEAMCKEWVDVILLEESGTWIWPVLNAPYRRILQFFEDIDLKKKLFGKAYQNYILLHIDLQQKEKIGREELYSLLLDQLTTENFTDFGNVSIEKVIKNFLRNKKNIVFFVTGIDTSIRSNNWETVEELSALAQSNWNIRVLLFTETDITSPTYFAQFNKRTTLSQHITITPLYSLLDSESFISYLCFNWDIVLTAEQKKYILQMAGGHYLLIKDILRQIKNNASLPLSTIISLPSVQLRIVSILNNFSDDERRVLYAVATKQHVSKNLEHAKNFLLSQVWIIKKDDTLQMTVAILKNALLSFEFKEGIQNELLLFTSTEKRLMDFLEKQLLRIVSREELAKVIWEDKHEEKYSDWAIDQLIHKLREKIRKVSLPYEIVTKKGEGFILVDKLKQV